VGSLPTHKFEKYAVGDAEYATLPECAANNRGFLYMVEVYVDDFISLVILVSQEQLRHVATAVMTGIRDVFPGDAVESNDSILEKKLIKHEGRYATLKTLLGFNFNITAKTMWLEAAKREKLLTILKSWVRTGKRGTAGIPFKEYESVILKLCHAFISIPAGVGLLSPCYWVFQAQPSYIYLHKNKRVLHALQGCRTLLRESTREPTRCRELTSGWPDFVGIVDTSSHGDRGVVFGKLSACTPTVFQWQWTNDICTQLISNENTEGTITNSDLEMVGLLLLWLTMEGVCGPLQEKRVAMFGDNSPSISWVERVASKQSLVAENLAQALALRLKIQRACPLTTIHIAGRTNTISDVPS
jgi:hypothetical protein